MSATISQREARRLRKRVLVLEAAEQVRRRRWGYDWPGGVEIARIDNVSIPANVVRTARALNHAVIALGDATSVIRLIALPHPKVDA